MDIRLKKPSLTGWASLLAVVKGAVGSELWLLPEADQSRPLTFFWISISSSDLGDNVCSTLGRIQWGDAAENVL